MKLSRIGTCREQVHVPYVKEAFFYLFNLGWYSVQLHILSISWLLARGGVDGRGGYILNRQKPSLLLSAMKVICHCWRSLLTKSQLFVLIYFYYYYYYYYYYYFYLDLLSAVLTETFISQLGRGMVTCSRWWAIGYFRNNPKKWHGWQLRT